jgi:transcription elongation factor GreA
MRRNGYRCGEQERICAMKKEYKMSQTRYQELQDELTYLKTVREKEVAELIKEARGFGDLSENSEYDEAKNEQGKLYSRIAEIEEILLNSVIIDESEMLSNTVSIGCRVTVVELGSGKELPEYKVVGSQEADPMNRAISEESPFGKALMGAKEGDEISVEAPVGTIRYRVAKIER